LGNHEALEDLLLEKFGSRTLSEFKYPKVFAVAAYTKETTPSPYLFRNYSIDEATYDGTSIGSIYDAARATSAAPVYLRAHQINGMIFQDGGLGVNNPSFIAYVEAKKLWPNKELGCLISLGTAARITESKNNSSVYNSPTSDVLEKALHVATSPERIHQDMMGIIDKQKYLRLQLITKIKADLAETDKKKLNELKKEAREYVTNHVDSLKEVLNL